MKQYLGAKLVKAEPASRGEYPGYFVQYPEGYSSWSPKASFEEAYRQIDGMPFGLALEALRKGFKVRCKGWPEGRHLEFADATEYKFPYIREVYASGGNNMWLAPQIDLLAEDWMIILE